MAKHSGYKSTVEAISSIKKAIDRRDAELNLSFQNLNDIPKSWGSLKHVKTLNLSGNLFTELPECLRGLTQLQKLDLSRNKLTIIPEWIGELTNLQILALSENDLTEIPNSIRHLKHLKILDLSTNSLKYLPESLGHLSQLASLHLSDNEIAKLPSSIGELIEIQTLNLSRNQLQTLPESIRNLPRLHSIFLHGNPDLGFMAEVLGPTWGEVIRKRIEPARAGAILEYYFRIKTGKRPLNEAKLILVGRGNVGKTSVVNRLMHNRFNSKEQKTEGIQINNWHIRLQDREEVKLHIWDFGGQEIMHATHQFFLTQRSLYLLVLNGREGAVDSDAEYWLKIIESFGGDSPVIVVMNKINEHPFDLNRRGLQQKYPFIKGFVKTDCEDGMGFEDLHRTIELETNQLEHLRDPFPASWLAIKDELANTRINYLSFEEFRRICTQNGEIDEQAQEDLAGYLHNLGIAINYREDPRLQEMHILNPHWVTNGIYKIINATQLEKQKGILALNDTNNLLESREYPLHMRRFILDLMKKFELCFSFPEDDFRYLIPELLDKEEPPEVRLFEDDNCLHFQYHYPILPEGLLPRFIVRTHVLSERLSRWRTGVILKFEDNLALVKADVQDKKVFIKVKGSLTGRRRLLAIIRSDFERIHYDIRQLKPHEMVPLPNHPEVSIPYQKLKIMEGKGIKTFPEVVGDDVIEVDVLGLLNGIDLIEASSKDITVERGIDTVRLFYSYSHKDETLRNELETHLKLLQRKGLISTWHDRQIEAGEEWKQKIDDNLERADIILLLVSADFIASDYCYAIEMKRALERHEKGEARVIPVIVRDVNMSGAPFAKLQALPKDALAVTLWPNKDSAWRNVAEGIEKAAKSVRQKRGFI